MQGELTCLSLTSRLRHGHAAPLSTVLGLVNREMHPYEQSCNRALQGMERCRQRLGLQAVGCGGTLQGWLGSRMHPGCSKRMQRHMRNANRLLSFAFSGV